MILFQLTGKNRWQDGINAWITQNHAGDQTWNPPADLLGNPTPTPTPNGNPTDTPQPNVTATDTPTPTPGQ